MKFIFRASIRFAYQFTNKRGRKESEGEEEKGRRTGPLVDVMMPQDLRHVELPQCLSELSLLSRRHHKSMSISNS